MDTRSKYNILYVDDEESNLRVFKGLYRRKYNVYTALSAKEALLIFDQQQLHLVISDQRMPDIDGLDFLSKVKSKCSLIPTILITGFADHDVLKNAINSNKVHKYINKPYDPTSLATVMELAIEGYLINQEKEQIQEKLRLSEDKFRGIFNSLVDVFVRVNFEGIIQVVSPSALELVGFSPEELIGMNIRSLYANPEERSGIIETLKRVELIREKEILLLTKSGARKWISTSLRIFYDSKGNPAGTEGIMRDISVRKEMQELLQEQNEILDETQRLAKVGSWSYDPSTDKLKYSDTLLDIYGLNSKSNVPNSLEEYISFFQPLDEIRVRKLISRTVKLQKDFSFEATIVRPDGNKRNLSVLGKVVSTKEKLLKKITVACLDVTEIRNRENELIRSEEKFRLLTEQLPVRVLKIDNKLNILFANKLAYGAYYKQRKGKQKVHFFFNKNALPEVIEAINQTIENGKGSYLEYKSKNKWYALKVTAVSEQSGLGNLLLFIDDITHKKESEELLKNINQKLEGKVRERTKELEEAKDNIERAYFKEKELGELKSQFVSTASHQFRTPLTVIQSSISLLEMHVQKESSEFKEKFDRVYNRVQPEIKRMTELMDSVLVLGKKESGNIKPDFQVTDVLSFVETIVQKHNEIQADARRIKLTYEGSPAMYQLDHKLFEHAFSNLICNAFKYSKSKPSPLVQLRFKNSMLIIMVQDFGVGIPEEDVNHIFEPFYRARNVKNIEGTGMGTAIVKAYLELMDMTVAVESEQGSGTTFTIKIEK